METIRSQAGAATGLIVTMQDATEFREAQRQRESLRTQLYHAQRVESLGVLAGGIAHDLNNTLVPVLALSESMLKSPAIGEAQRPLVDLIHKGGVRARDLVRQILSFSRRENPNSQLIALAPFVRESLQLARAGIPTTIRIEEAIADVPPIMGDRSQLHQVMLNLIANAAHAIGEQQGIVTVELSADVAHGLDGEKENRNNCVRISVSDTGKGMDEKTQERIFEPFFTTKRVGEGSGLGLAVVHGIVAAHRGRIVVSSKVGTGSRFDVLLPLVDGNDGQGVP
jgi:signal transduction histidine kinase